MSFMQKQITSKQSWLEVETTHGTEFLPQELVANVANCYEDAEDDDSFNKVQQYTEGEPQSWKWIEGYGARMSAPGYMDCTEWTVFDTEQEAQAYLDEMYGDDEEDEEIMTLTGNHYTAREDRMGNVIIRRKHDGATVLLQGDDAMEFIDNHRILDAIEYPSGPFKTQAEHVDACLDAYDEVMEVEQ